MCNLIVQYSLLDEMTQTEKEWTNKKVYVKKRQDEKT